MLTPLTGADTRISLCETGLVLGVGTRLAQFAGATDRLVIDHERLEAMFAVAFRRAPSDRDLSAIEAASTHWQRGDKALANLRLVFADLPRLDDGEDAVRLKAAELLFDAGLRADDLAKAFDADPSADSLGKYDPDQPRVPAGSGKESGRWAALWSRFSAWLDEEVPEYDNDFGTQVGTRSRARAIFTNPLTIVAGGAAILLAPELLAAGATTLGIAAPEIGVATAIAATEGVDALTAATVATEGAATILPVAEGAAIAPIVEEAEALTPFAQRYLSTSGGRLGNTATRRQLYELAEKQAATKKYTTFQGDGRGPEEFLRDPVTGKGTYVDLTAKSVNGSTVRFQTIDTLADGVTPTARELAAAARIRTLRPNDKLILVPKQ